MAWHPFAGGALLIAGSATGLIWARRPARRHREAVRARIVPALCRYLGTEEYHRKPGKRFEIARVQKSGIAGAFTRAAQNGGSPPISPWYLAGACRTSS